MHAPDHRPTWADSPGPARPLEMITRSALVHSVDQVIWILVSVLGLVVEMAAIVALGLQTTAAYEERCESDRSSASSWPESSRRTADRITGPSSAQAPDVRTSAVNVARLPEAAGSTE